MKKFRDIFMLVLVMVFAVAMIGIAGSSTAEEWVWERRVEFLIPHGAGGGTDTTARALIPYLEEELGVSFVARNMSGGSGIIGMTYMHNQPADGYTYSITTPSPLGAHAIEPTQNFNLLEDTAMVACLVHDTNLVLVGADSPFDNFTEFVDYAKDHPGELTLSIASIKGSDGASLIQLMEAAGIEVTLAVYSGAETTLAVLSGETDATLGTPTDVKPFIDSGDLKPLVALSEERLPGFPDLECTDELGYEAYFGAWRGVVCKKGTPQAAIDSLGAAIMKISTENEEWDAWRKKNGLNERLGWRDAEEFEKLWYSTYKTMAEIFATLD